MRVLIQALSQQGGSRLCRAGRFFPTSDPLEVEVLDQEQDPPPIEVMVPNGTTGRMQKETRPDPVRMGQASYRAVKADRRMRLIEEGAVNSAAADAAVQAARAEVMRMSGELSDARVEIAKLGAEVARLTGELDEATKPVPVSNVAVTSPTTVVPPAAAATRGRAPSAPTTVVPSEAPALDASENVVGPTSPSAGRGGMPLPAPTTQAGAPVPAAAKETPPSA